MLMNHSLVSQWSPPADVSTVNDQQPGAASLAAIERGQVDAAAVVGKRRRGAGAAVARSGRRAYIRQRGRGSLRILRTFPSASSIDRTLAESERRHGQATLKAMEWMGSHSRGQDVRMQIPRTPHADHPQAIPAGATESVRRRDAARRTRHRAPCALGVQQQSPDKTSTFRVFYTNEYAEAASPPSAPLRRDRLPSHCTTLRNGSPAAVESRSTRPQADSFYRPSGCGKSTVLSLIAGADRRRGVDFRRAARRPQLSRPTCSSRTPCSRGRPCWTTSVSDWTFAAEAPPRHEVRLGVGRTCRPERVRPSRPVFACRRSADTGSDGRTLSGRHVRPTPQPHFVPRRRFGRECPVRDGCCPARSSTGAGRPAGTCRPHDDWCRRAALRKSTPCRWSERSVRRSG